MLINNSEWEIRFVSPTSSILRNSNGKYTLGVTIPQWKKIYIANSIKGILLKRVLAHEIAHAEFASRGVFVPEYIEEVLADIISDNIVDTYNLTNEYCSLTGNC